MVLEILTKVVEFYSLIILVQFPNRNSPRSSFPNCEIFAMQLGMCIPAEFAGNRDNYGSPRYLRIRDSGLFGISWFRNYAQFEIFP